MRVILDIRAIALSMLSAHAYGYPAPYPPLPALNIDISETSVSGLSSGGFMAVQLAVAYSSIIKGVGVVAAGPYYCSQNDLLIATSRCSCTIQPSSACQVSQTSTNVPKLVSLTRASSASHIIDDVSNITRQRIVTLSGASDATVPTPVVTQLQQFYAALDVPAQSISKIELADAGHTMPTMNYGLACATSESPFIGRCHVDCRASNKMRAARQSG